MANNRSAFESIPGRDALFEYESKIYPIKTYVERNGLIFKSITATSENFLLSQWELVGDLREVRVPDIAARNSLTGTTGTSYGVHTPILDNTNVLVLDASADPQVGSAQFARYNYNQGGASWLLLQVGTGSTSASTSIEYSNVLNRPFIVSGVTVIAGGGLSGGGSIFGSIPAAGGTITLLHADTSSQTNIIPTGRTYIQQLKFDTYGHVTGATSSTWTHPDTSSQATINNTGRTYIQSISVDGDGHVTSLSSSPWTHPDTSSQANSINTGNTFIQSIFLDGAGHVTGIGVGTAVIDGGSSLKVNGDSGGVITITSGGTLTISGGTNILTQRTGNATNAGIKINFNAAGSVGQVQYNNGSGVSASSNFVFSAGTNTLRVSNLNLGSLPSNDDTLTQLLVRDNSSGTIKYRNVESIIRTDTISVSSAEILNLFSSPKILIAAPGVGKFINVIAIMGYLQYNTTTYATNTQLNIRYNNLSVPIPSTSWNIAQTESKIYRFTTQSTSTGEASATLLNQPVTLAALSGNPTTGDGTIKVYITYQIITL